MLRFTLLACSVFLLLGTTAFADDDVPFLNFTLVDPLPESIIGEPVDDTEVELERIQGGVVIEGETAGLLPDHAYTIWALVFNNPAGCNDGCQIADDIGPDSGFAALWTGIGFVADEDGEAEFDTVMMEGDPAGEVLMGEGLTDAGNAEIHLIVRYHGPAAYDDPDLLEDQLTTFGGGCVEFGCDDVQYAVLEAERDDDDDDDDDDNDDNDDYDDDDDDDEVSFLHFMQDASPPEPMIGGPVNDTEVELERIQGGVLIEGETSELLPGHAYTIWALVYNDPDGCNDGCDIFDDMGSHSEFSALWSGIGFVADEDGEAEFEAVMMEGDPAGEVLMGEGLTDAGNAEIHLIVRHHGAAAYDDPDLLEAQLTTFGGGCEEFGCNDVQYAFLVADDDDDDDDSDGDEYSFVEFMIGSPLQNSDSGDAIAGSEIRFEQFDDGFFIEAETSGLEPGFTYTIWAGVFNDPGECAGDCDISDFGVDGWSILWTGVGLVADEDGELEFEAIVIENEPAGEIVTGPGLTDMDNAEIHLFVRSHGPASDDPEVLEAQLSQLMGGCDIYGCGVPQYAVLVAGD